MTLSTDVKNKIVGISHARARKIIEDDGEGVKYSKEVIKLSGLKSVAFDPNQEKESDYADNIKWVTYAGALDGKLTVKVFKLSDKAKVDLLNYKEKSEGVIAVTSDNTPDVAFSFIGTDSAKGYKGYIFLKGSFSHINEDFKTKSDKPEIGDGDTLEGEFSEPVSGEGLYVVVDLGKFSTMKEAVAAFDAKEAEVLDLEG